MSNPLKMKLPDPEQKKLRNQAQTIDAEKKGRNTQNLNGRYNGHLTIKERNYR